MGAGFLIPGDDRRGEVDFEELLSQSLASRIRGTKAYPQLGIVVAAGRDLNCDGRPDLALAHVNATKDDERPSRIAAVVVFGREQPFDEDIDTILANGGGFAIESSNPGDSMDDATMLMARVMSMVMVATRSCWGASPSNAQIGARPVRCSSSTESQTASP